MEEVEYTDHLKPSDKEKVDKEMKYNYDKKSDSLFIYLNEGEEDRFEEIVPGINIELDENDEVIGVEILKASRLTKNMKKPAEAVH